MLGQCGGTGQCRVPWRTRITTKAMTRWSSPLSRPTANNRTMRCDPLVNMPLQRVRAGRSLCGSHYALSMRRVCNHYERDKQHPEASDTSIHG